MEKHAQKPNRSIKWVFVMLFAGLFLFSENVFAGTIFIDNFENYNIGTVAGQGGWDIIADMSSAGEIISIDGTQVLKIGGIRESAEKSGSSTISGSIFFDLQFQSTDTDEDAQYLFQIDKTAPRIELGFAGNCLNDFLISNWLDGNEVYYKSFACDIFHTIEIKWSGADYRIREVGDAWSDIWSVGSPGSGFDSVQFWQISGANNSLLIDNITDFPLPIIATITPIYPPENATTTISGEFFIIGLYSYNTSTEFTIIGLEAIFTDKTDATSRFIFNYNPGEINSGSFSIRGDLPDGDYFLTYRFVYILDPNIPILLARYYYFQPETDLINVSIIYSTYEDDFYPELNEEDCSGLSGAELWLCKIKNVFSGLFYISPGKMIELNASVEQMKDKFPYNYIEVDKNFFTSLNSGINSTSSISFTILNNTQNVNFDLLKNSTGTVAGTTQNTADVLKNLFSIIILFGFLIYAIAFGRRIFK